MKGIHYCYGQLNIFADQKQFFTYLVYPFEQLADASHDLSESEKKITVKD